MARFVQVAVFRRGRGRGCDVCGYSGRCGRYRYCRCSFPTRYNAFRLLCLYCLTFPFDEKSSFQLFLSVPHAIQLDEIGSRL